MYAADMIRDLGYDVLEAQSADEAIGIIDSKGDVRIVFTDIQMPGSMDGLKLAALIRQRWPSTDVLVTSGALQAKDLDLPAGCVFVSKPCPLATLAEQLSLFLAG